MTRHCFFLVCASITVAWYSIVSADDATITIKGIVLNEVHTGEREQSVFVYALDGTPEIRAEVEKLVAEYYPDKGLDAEAARKLQDQFTAKLKYFIDGAIAGELHQKATYGARQPTALTGTVSEKDGRRWITVGKAADTTLHYPAKMLAPDKPWVMPDRPPFVVRINDRLSLRCIWVAPGKFFMGEPYYQCPHWQEDPPHMVTLTKGFYMAEQPITQEMFAAVVGGTLGNEKAAKAPVNSLMRANVRVLPDLIAKDRKKGPRADRRGMGIRGPRGHVQPDV